MIKRNLLSLKYILLTKCLASVKQDHRSPWEHQKLLHHQSSHQNWASGEKGREKEKRKKIRNPGIDKKEVTKKTQERGGEGERRP